MATLRFDIPETLISLPSSRIVSRRSRSIALNWIPTNDTPVPLPASRTLKLGRESSPDLFRLITPYSNCRDKLQKVSFHTLLTILYDLLTLSSTYPLSCRNTKLSNCTM